MDFTVMLAIATGASLLVVVGFKLIGDPHRRRARRMLAAAGALTADPEDGATVRATGIVRAIGPAGVLRSPLAVEKCVAFRAVAVARGGRSPAGTVICDERCVSFVLDCGELGRVLVEGSQAVLDLPPVRLSRRDHDARNRFLRDHEQPYANSLRSEFEETIVPIGARVSVAGVIAVGAPRTEYGLHDTTLRFASTSPIAIGRPGTP